MSSAQGMEIIGWYDGVTEAFVRDADGRWSYASMITWNPSTKLRIFGVVSVDAAAVDTAREILRTAPNTASHQRSWDDTRTFVSSLLKTSTGQAELRLCEQIDEPARMSLKLDIGEIREHLGRDIDDILDGGDFASWISKFRTHTK